MIVEFSMWTPFHYFMMIFPFVLTFILYFFTRNKGEKAQFSVGLILSIVLVLILIVRNVYIWHQQGVINPEVFPFQVCHFANLIYLVAILAKDPAWGTIGWCLNFPAGLVSVIFADGLENYPTMINTQAIAYIAGHMLIVTTGLYMLLAGTIKINWQSMKKMFLFVGSGYLLSVPVNSWFNKLFAFSNKTANYFYTFKPEGGTPLEAMYNLGESYTVFGITLNPVYLLLLAGVGLAVLLAMYGLYLVKAQLAAPDRHKVSPQA